jgi:hypothetical protein
MKIIPTVADALAGARYPVPVQPDRKSVLVAGASGRLGERVLARVLGTLQYHRIYVLASEAMPSTEAKLTALRQSDWTFRADHVIAVISEENKKRLPARSRTEVFSMLTADQVVPLACHAKSLGVSRFMLVTPTNILSQPSAVYAQLANLMEAELHRIGFDSLLLVRPSDHEIRQRQRGLAMRLPGLLIDTITGLMSGARHAPLSIEDTARAAVRAMQDSALGLSILEPDRLHQLLKF